MPIIDLTDVGLRPEQAPEQRDETQPQEEPSGRNESRRAAKFSRNNARRAGIVVLVVAAVALVVDLVEAAHPVPTGVVCTVTAAAVPLITHGVGDEESVSLIVARTLGALATPDICRSGISALINRPLAPVLFKVLDPNGGSSIRTLRGVDLLRGPSWNDLLPGHAPAAIRSSPATPASLHG